MTNEWANIVQRLWNYCNVLRDDGMSYGDYLEQLTYLLFLKMDDENVHVLASPAPSPRNTTGPACAACRATSWKATTARF